MLAWCIHNVIDMNDGTWNLVLFALDVETVESAQFDPNITCINQTPVWFVYAIDEITSMTVTANYLPEIILNQIPARNYHAKAMTVLNKTFNIKSILCNLANENTLSCGESQLTSNARNESAFVSMCRWNFSCFVYTHPRWVCFFLFAL